MPAARLGPALLARRPIRETGPSGLDGLVSVRLPSAGQALRRPLLPPSIAFHGALVAMLLLAAPRVLPPEQEQVSTPLVFEPIQTALVAAPEASTPAGAAVPPPLDTPLPTPPDADPVPTLPMSELAPAVPHTSLLPDVPAVAELTPQTSPEPDLLPLQAPVPDNTLLPAPAIAQAPVPRLRSPSATRTVPHLPSPHVERKAHPSVPSADAVDTVATNQPALASADAAAVMISPHAAAGQAAAAQANQAAAASIPARPLAVAPGNVQPEYPEQAKRRGIEGRVVIQAVVSADGRTASASVATSSGSQVLDQAALVAVRSYRFSPASRGGVAVQGVAELPFTFRLQK